MKALTRRLVMTMSPSSGVIAGRGSTSIVDACFLYAPNTWLRGLTSGIPGRKPTTTKRIGTALRRAASTLVRTRVEVGIFVGDAIQGGGLHIHTTRAVLSLGLGMRRE